MICKAIRYNWVTNFAQVFKAFPCFYGSGCILPCHCANNATCDSITGQCPGTCDTGLLDDSRFDWSGSSCQLGKIF